MKRGKLSLTLKIAFVFERILAIVVLFAVLLGTIDILRMIWQLYIVEYDTIVLYSQLNDMLGQILLLVIGVELVVMLSLHIPGALIEALLYAIARKMLLLPKSEGMTDVLLGVLAIAGLFAIRKYLVIDTNKSLDVTSIHIRNDEKDENYEENENYEKNEKLKLNDINKESEVLN